MSKYINFIKTGVLVSIIGLFINVQSASAVTVPTFPSCLNPQGTLKVSYSDGTHGVVGDTKTYTGYDAVYKLTDNTLVQCLCPKDGNGIQTNWMKASGFSQSEINTLKNDGWVYIQNGSAWGLDNEPYLAKNIGYSCIVGRCPGPIGIILRMVKRQ
jgi:hypothetical protein